MNSIKEIIKIIEKASNLETKFRSTYNEECKKIKERYTSNVAMEMIHKLDLGHRADMQLLEEDVDNILARELKHRKENLQIGITEAYKKERTESVNILLSLGDKLGKKETEKLLVPIIEAKDTDYLNILSHTSNQGTKTVYDEALKGIEAYTNGDDISVLANETKRYLNNPAKGKSYNLELAIYNADSEVYDRLRTAKQSQ